MVSSLFTWFQATVAISSAENSDKYIMPSDFSSNEVPLSVSVLGKKDASLSKREITKILCNPKKGIKVRRANRDSKQILYFKGIRLYECFVDKNGAPVNVKNSKQVEELGQWLLNEKYIILNKVVDQKKREIARNKDPNPVFSKDGFYTWTQYAAILLQNGSTEDSDSDGDIANVDFSKEPSSKPRNRGSKKNKSNKSEDEELISKIRDDLGMKGNNHDGGNEGGVSWLHIGILFMIFAPSLFALVGYFMPAETPKQKLMNFYAKYAPEKNTAEHINKLLKKYQGKEDRLFRKLERKYDEQRIREEAMKRDER